MSKNYLEKFSHMPVNRIVRIRDANCTITFWYCELRDPGEEEYEIWGESHTDQERWYYLISNYGDRKKFRIPHAWYKTGQAIFCSDQIAKLDEDGNTISTHKVVIVKNRIVISGTALALSTNADGKTWKFV
jgi:hypothetical protein